MKIRKNIIWKLYIWILFTTEIISFNFIGNLRLYYLLTFFVLFLFCRILYRIIENKILNKLLLFLSFLIFTALLSSYTKGALASIISLGLNIATAFSVYLILTTKKLSEEEFLYTLENVLLFNVVYGLVSLIIYRISGFTIWGSSNSAIQLQGMQIAGLRTEANTHGKLCCYCVAYCIPFAILKKIDKRKKLLLVLSLITLIVSPTRSATYALLTAVILFLAYLLYYRKGTKVIKLVMNVVILFGIVMVLVNTQIIKIEGYSLTKLTNFFLTDIDSIKADGSGGFRFASFEAAMNLWKQNIKTVLFGFGYNQAIGTLQNGTVETVLSGVEAMGVLLGGGILSLTGYIFSYVYAIKCCLEKAKGVICEEKLQLYSILTCLVLSFVLSFTSASMYVPETWVSFGLLAYYMKIPFSNSRRGMVYGNVHEQDEIARNTVSVNGLRRIRD